MTEEISLWAAFSGGILSFGTPCVLPLVPVYLASLAGSEILEPGMKRIHLPILFHSLVFVIGFSLVFISIGALVGLAGVVINPYSPVVQGVAGGLLIGFGLLMLVAMKVPWLNFEKRFTPSMGNTTSYLRSFLIGAVFPIAWVPCTSFVLGGIVTLAATSETVWQGAYLLAFYSLGLGLPFLVVGAAFDYIVPLLKRFSRYSNWVYITGGVLLITVGIFVLTGKLTWLNSILA